MTALLLKGLILGFSIAAPVGPIGVLTIRRTLAGGFACGLASGVGTAVADALYGLIAAFGLTAVTSLLVDLQPYLRLGGGLFLCYLGWAAFRAEPASVAASARGESLWAASASAFALTLTNPMTILSFAAVFAGLGLAGDAGYSGAAVTVLGVFTGSLLWWLMLSGGVTLLRARFDHRRLRTVNRLSGLVIFAFGAACLISL